MASRSACVLPGREVANCITIIAPGPAQGASASRLSTRPCRSRAAVAWNPPSAASSAAPHTTHASESSDSASSATGTIEARSLKGTNEALFYYNPATGTLKAHSLKGISTRPFSRSCRSERSQCGADSHHRPLSVCCTPGAAGQPPPPCHSSLCEVLSRRAPSRTFQAPPPPLALARCSRPTRVRRVIGHNEGIAFGDRCERGKVAWAVGGFPLPSLLCFVCSAPGGDF